MVEHNAPEIAIWKRLLRFARNVIDLCGSRSLITIVLLVVGGITEGFSLLMLLPLLQVLAQQSAATPGIDTQVSLEEYLGISIDVSLWVMLVAFVCFVATNAFISQYKTVYINRVAIDAVDRLRLDLFNSILMARWERIASLRKTDLNHILTGDIDRVMASILGIFLLTQNLILLCAYLALSFLVSPEMTIFSILSGTLVFVSMAPVRRRALKYSRELTSAMQMQYRTVGDFLGGLKTTKSFNAETRYAQALADNLRQMNRGRIGFIKLTAKANFLFQISSVVTACGFVITAIGYFEMEVARVLVLLLVFMRLVPRLSSSQGYMQGVLSNVAAFEEVLAVRDACSKERERSHEIPADAFNKTGRIALEGVSYSYDKNRALDDVDVVFLRGSITAITGPSGSGKSTLADILLGLILPSNGFIYVDGTRLCDENLRSWRQRVAYVPQESYLLAASIADNLRLGYSDATDDEMWQALRIANAEDFVKALPLGLKTIVGDGGRLFSGGERQRISLARALLREPALLVLDEPTSALDERNTQHFISSIRKIKTSMTVVLITHNPSVVRVADTVIALSDGYATVAMSSPID